MATWAKGRYSHDIIYEGTWCLFAWTRLRSLGHASKTHVAEKLYQRLWGSTPPFCWLGLPDGIFVPMLCMYICKTFKRLDTSVCHNWYLGNQSDSNMNTGAQQLIACACKAFTYLRCTLMCILLLAKHCYFVLEQPSNTLLQRHRRWEDFCNRTAYVSCWKIFDLSPAMYAI